MNKKPQTLQVYFRKNWGQIALHTFFIIACLTYILPMIVMITAGFTHQEVWNDPRRGFSLFPAKWSLEAYNMIFTDPTKVINGYKVTAAFSILSTAGHLLVCALFSYPISRDHFYFRKQINLLMILTMLFGAGGVASYVVNTQILGLGNNFWIYVIPSLFSVWNCIIIRTNYKSVPAEMLESARMDGASELTICFKMVMPLSKACFASLGFLFLVGKWNDWNTSMLYIRDQDLYSLQYRLHQVKAMIEEMKVAAQQGEMGINPNDIPTDSLEYAMALVTSGPMLVVFPFFQKYFAKGMTLGSVKG